MSLRGTDREWQQDKVVIHGQVRDADSLTTTGVYCPPNGPSIKKRAHKLEHWIPLVREPSSNGSPGFSQHSIWIPPMGKLYGIGRRPRWNPGGTFRGYQSIPLPPGFSWSGVALCTCSYMMNLGAAAAALEAEWSRLG